MKILQKQILLPILIAIVLSFILYGNSINGDFVADDKLVVSQNPLVAGRLSDLGGIFTAPYYYGQSHAGLYRPLTVASYNLNKFFSDRPFGFHLVNIILNALNGFLVFLIASKLANKKAAYMAMTLFLFLPIHSEAVSSIVGRAELMSFLFSALSLFFVLDKKYAWASAALFLGLLSKETAAGFFLVFLYLWKFREQRTLKQMFLIALYFVPSVAMYAILRAQVLGKYFLSIEHFWAYNPLRFESFLPSLWTSVKVFYLYVFKTFVPYKFSSDYSFNQIPVIKTPFSYYEVYAGIIVLIALVFIAARERKNVFGLSVAIFLFTYLPVSNWFVKIGTIMGERLIYAPSLGLVIMAAVAVTSVKLKVKNQNSRFKIFNLKFPLLTLHFLLLILFMWYGYVIVDRNRDWKNETALIKSAYSASPNSVVAVSNMAYLEFNNKDYMAAKQWIEKAIGIAPDHIPALYLSGHVHKSLGDFQSARLSWLKVIELNPGYIKAYLSLGILYYETEQFKKAEFVLNQGFGLGKRWNEAFPLALVKINLGKYSEAVRLVEDNFGENPQKRELKFALGLAHLKLGDKAKAEFYFNQTKEPNLSMENYFKKMAEQKIFKIKEY